MTPSKNPATQAGLTQPISRPDTDSREQLSVEDVVEAVLGSSRALVAVSARSIAGSPGVTLPQYRMLVVLSEGSSNLSKLAAALDVAPSTAMRMVDRLVAAGLVDRAVPENNRRATLLALTEAGRSTVRTVTTRRRRDLRSVIKRIPPDQYAPLTAAMNAFTEAAEQLWADDPGRTR